MFRNLIKSFRKPLKPIDFWVWVYYNISREVRVRFLLFATILFSSFTGIKLIFLGCSLTSQSLAIGLNITALGVFLVAMPKELLKEVGI